jgi:hypothetical protein
LKRKIIKNENEVQIEDIKSEKFESEHSREEELNNCQYNINANNNSKNNIIGFLNNSKMQNNNHAYKFGSINNKNYNEEIKNDNIKINNKKK